mmetsp:Transcript_23409/g.61284  ORF Transcript_23409/g.61284 Transcript_23409/m.61284 type:complete len:406 (-) Transcript_23409:224-1441(-)
MHLCENTCMQVRMTVSFGSDRSTVQLMDLRRSSIISWSTASPPVLRRLAWSSCDLIRFTSATADLSAASARATSATKLATRSASRPFSCRASWSASAEVSAAVSLAACSCRSDSSRPSCSAVRFCCAHASSRPVRSTSRSRSIRRSFASSSAISLVRATLSSLRCSSASLEAASACIRAVTCEKVASSFSRSCLSSRWACSCASSSDLPVASISCSSVSTDAFSLARSFSSAAILAPCTSLSPPPTSPRFTAALRAASSSLTFWSELASATLSRRSLSMLEYTLSSSFIFFSDSIARSVSALSVAMVESRSSHRRASATLRSRTIFCSLRLSPLRTLSSRRAASTILSASAAVRDPAPPPPAAILEVSSARSLSVSAVDCFICALKSARSWSISRLRSSPARRSS